MGKCNFRVSVNLILQNNGKICLMRRFNTGWNDGMYALMGGHVEDGENPISAIIREAAEELGIVISEDDINHVFTMAVNPDHIYLYFACENYKGIITNKEPDQCDDVRFFDINSIPENIIEADKKALNIIFGNNKSKYEEFGYSK